MEWISRNFRECAPNELDHMCPRSGQSGTDVGNRIIEDGDTEELGPRY